MQNIFPTLGTSGWQMGGVRLTTALGRTPATPTFLAGVFQCVEYHGNNWYSAASDPIEQVEQVIPGAVP